MRAPPLASLFTPAWSLLQRMGEWQPHRVSVWNRFAVALLITTVAVWARVALAPAESGGRFVTLALAAALSALYGGFRAGMLSTLVGMLAVNFLMVRPYFSLAFESPLEAFWLNLWHLLTQLAVVGSIAVMQRQHARLADLRSEHQRSHQQLEATFEHSATGMAHSEINGRWIRINQTYCDLVGYSHEEMMGMTFLDITHPEDLHQDLGLLRRLLAREIPHYQMEKRYLHRDGRVVWVHLTLSLVRQPDGSPDYLIAVVKDIGERKKTEEALRTSEQLLRQAQRLAGLATWRADVATRRFTALTDSSEVLGLPAGEFSDEELLARTHPDDKPVVLRQWAAAVQGHGSYNLEYRLSFDGRERWFSVQAEFERNANGRAVRALGVTQDITARKRAELEIQRLNTSLEQRIQLRTQALRGAYNELESYSYAVAHDLRSPLRIINGFAQALQEDNPALDATSQQHLQRIMAASKKMGELIDGLLQLSQVGRGPLQRTTVDLSAIARRLLEEQAAQEPGRRVEWSVQDGLRADADASLVDALLQNLLHNAWKYTAGTPAATIRVWARQHEGRTWFCVQDNGAGFDMARADKLFQPFQRLHMPHEFGGLGIGLATALRIVQRHGGVFEAEGTPGKGARFAFTLPAGDPAEANAG